MVLEPLGRIGNLDRVLEIHVLDQIKDGLSTRKIGWCEATPRQTVVELLDLIAQRRIGQAEGQGMLGHVVAPPNVAVAIEATLNDGLEEVLGRGTIAIATRRVMLGQNLGAVIPGLVLVEPGTPLLGVIDEVSKARTFKNSGLAGLDVEERAATCNHVGHVAVDHLPGREVEVLEQGAVAEHLGKAHGRTRIPSSDGALVDNARAALEHA